MDGVLTFDILAEHELEDLVRGEADTGAAGRLLCAVCGQWVTTPAQRIDVQGLHTHRFTNPAGIEFEIGCFSAARGCRETGAATQAWTWFPGYRWRIALCAGCRTHLGWSYAGAAGAHFFGLILARLVMPA